jgi:hypothetical protein
MFHSFFVPDRVSHLLDVVATISSVVVVPSYRSLADWVEWRLIEGVPSTPSSHTFLPGTRHRRPFQPVQPRSSIRIFPYRYWVPHEALVLGALNRKISEVWWLSLFLLAFSVPTCRFQ